MSDALTPEGMVELNAAINGAAEYQRESAGTGEQHAPTCAVWSPVARCTCGTEPYRASELNLQGRFTVASMSGVAFWIKRYHTEWTEESWEMVCDNTGDHDHNSDCDSLYNEPELVENRDFVVAVMVGDDREHVIEVSELTEIKATDYCRDCGQIGCMSNVYE